MAVHKAHPIYRLIEITGQVFPVYLSALFVSRKIPSHVFHILRSKMVLRMLKPVCNFQSESFILYPNAKKE
jgi:hypothetical protein